jgi:hypothetical protein
MKHFIQSMKLTSIIRQNKQCIVSILYKGKVHIISLNWTFKPTILKQLIDSRLQRTITIQIKDGRNEISLTNSTFTLKLFLEYH